MPDLRFVPEWFDTSLTTPDERAACIAFGVWVHEARRATGKTQAAFGRLVGLHQSTISRIERGQVRHLIFATAVRLLVVILEAFVVPRPARIPPMPRMAWAW